MNSNKREILVFAKTDTCNTALEGRIVRAHKINALAYCWLFCFLTVRPIFYLFLSYLNLLSTKFCIVIRSCCSFDQLTSDFPYPTH